MVVPVLIKVEQNQYKLIYIDFANDGSIYIYFPRKKGYQVIKEINLPEKIIGEQTISLQKLNREFSSPYISFHSRNKSIHINTVNKEKYKMDAEVINMAEDKNILAFPLCQILFSEFSYLDIYSSNKYLHPLVIETKSLEPKVCLSLEIWIHPVGSYFELQDLPLYKARKERTKLIGVYRFNSSKLKLYTCSLVIAETKLEIKDNNIPGIIVAVFNDKEPYIFELAPLKQ